MSSELLQIAIGMWPFAIVLAIRAVLRGLLASPAATRPTRVRIGITEWDRHDMQDGSEVFLQRGGGTLGQHELKRGRT